MNRPIKFRGRFDNTGILIHGDLKHASNKIFISGYQVDPDSVAQLVGYDADGREVYEGDTITNGQGYETTVQYGGNPDFVHLHKLKEATT